MLAPKPNTLHIDILRHVPNLLRGIDSIGIIGVHDSCVVEDHIRSTPGVLGFDHGLDVGFLGDIALDGLNLRRGGDKLPDFGDSFHEGRGRDISHKDVGALAGKKDASFKTDSAAGVSDAFAWVWFLVFVCVFCLCVCVWEGLHLPCGTGDDGILALETASGGSHCRFELSGMIID